MDQLILLGNTALRLLLALCIGGGISNERETLMAPVRAFVEADQYARNSSKKTVVCRAELGNDAGIIGAALLGKEA